MIKFIYRSESKICITGLNYFQHVFNVLAVKVLRNFWEIVLGLGRVKSCWLGFLIDFFRIHKPLTGDKIGLWSDSDRNTECLSGLDQAQLISFQTRSVSDRKLPPELHAICYCFGMV